MSRATIIFPSLSLVLVAVLHGCSDGKIDNEASDAAIGGDASTQDSSVAVDAGNQEDSSVEDSGTDSSSDVGVDAGPPSGALTFDGADDHVILPAATGGANEGAFTAELWFKGKTLTAGLFEVYGSGADRMLSLNAGKVCFYVYGPPVQVCTTATTYSDGEWHHAAGTVGSGGMHLYVDGALAAGAATPTQSTFTNDVGFEIGAGHVSFNSAIYRLAGAIDEVRVWSVERSAADILANYKQHLAGSTAGLQGYWKLDGTGSDAKAHDETPGAHDGTLTNFSFTSSPWLTAGAF